MTLTRRQVLAAGAALPLALAAAPASAARPPSGGGALPDVVWAGRTWHRRSWPGGPGPNTWDPAGPTVDTAGAMHLRIRRSGGAWTCSELKSDGAAFGTYEWTVAGPVHALDPNVVLGLFVYADDGREIDVEIARWGNARDADAMQWAVQPASVAGNLRRFPLPAAASVTARMTWSPGVASFSGTALMADGSVVALPDWTSSAAPTSDTGVNLHMNLWLYQGRQPTNRLPVDVAVSRFAYTPPGAPSTSVTGT